MKKSKLLFIFSCIEKIGVMSYNIDKVFAHYREYPGRFPE